jgi:hypothetical protein
MIKDRRKTSSSLASSSPKATKFYSEHMQHSAEWIGSAAVDVAPSDSTNSTQTTPCDALERTTSGSFDFDLSALVKRAQQMADEATRTLESVPDQFAHVASQISGTSAKPPPQPNTGTLRLHCTYLSLLLRPIGAATSSECLQHPPAPTQRHARIRQTRAAHGVWTANRLCLIS